ncbi:hypothetical protein HOU02_gp074 [Caulobacter phage CcrBL9]|uniref:Uncharacterized protein n=1 Tax=Caulobacter phage CcrBL9 TaxID=2283270 RepID=A0A385EEC5_9CAUD|nr:hypothetical protein HOU02_gp074 [Caulobacter phage CcrBL9]AXQ69098.1 hypothetical protein CcrBL9_gp074c [Caulobacter phage CcrBL9]
MIAMMQVEFRFTQWSEDHGVLRLDWPEVQALTLRAGDVLEMDIVTGHCMPKWADGQDSLLEGQHKLTVTKVVKQIAGTFTGYGDSDIIRVVVDVNVDDLTLAQNMPEWGYPRVGDHDHRG